MYSSKGSKYKRSPTISTAPFMPRHTSRASSMRRLKIITLLFAITLTIFIFYRSSNPSSHSVSSDFYHKTKTALDADKEDHTSHKKPSSKAEAVAEAIAGKVEDTKQRLQDAAKEAKEKANAKAPKPDPPSSVIGVGSSGSGNSVSEPGAAGKKKWSTGDDEQKVVKDEKEESDEDHEVENELNAILKKAPVIIFSKSYCPHSARAKSILLEKYILDPLPYVVELDKHPLGLNLQASLAHSTKRKTVPNVLVNGVSIGGGDDIAALDESKELVEKIKSIAGKKMNEVRPRAGASKEREEEKKGKQGPVRGSDGAI